MPTNGAVEIFRFWGSVIRIVVSRNGAQSYMTEATGFVDGGGVRRCLAGGNDIKALRPFEAVLLP